MLSVFKVNCVHPVKPVYVGDAQTKVDFFAYLLNSLAIT